MWQVEGTGLGLDLFDKRFHPFRTPAAPPQARSPQLCKQRSRIRSVSLPNSLIDEITHFLVRIISRLAIRPAGAVPSVNCPVTKKVQAMPVFPNSGIYGFSIPTTPQQSGKMAHQKRAIRRIGGHKV